MLESRQIEFKTKRFNQSVYISPAYDEPLEDVELQRESWLWPRQGFSCGFPAEARFAVRVGLKLARQSSPPLLPPCSDGQMSRALK